MKEWIWLSKVKINPYKKYELIMKYKSPKIIMSLNKKELRENNLLNKEIEEIIKKSYKENLKKEENYLLKNNIKLLNIFDKDYPKKLKNIYDPPVVLYIKGNKNIFNKKSVAMVGCRMCSKYGEEQAKYFSYNLAKNDIVVVSGLARGIDKYSHIGCLAGKGKTIAVLGCGLNIMYPLENLEVARKIIETGGVIVSEYPIGEKPNRENFPQRNRIISGLSDYIIVVESKAKSGSMITVNFAIEQGKEIYAIPRKY